MELWVGFSAGRMEWNQQAEAIWRKFESSVVLPFTYSTFRAKAYAGPISGKAAAVLIGPGHPDFRRHEYARIVLDRQFLDLRDDQPFLTLLHESLHLASFQTYLATLHQAKRELVVHHDQCEELQGAELSKCQLAFLLADQLFEADAEFSLVTRYPDWAGARARFFVEMRRQSAAAPEPTLPPLLRGYALLAEMLRLELAALLVREDGDRDDVATLRRTIETAMLSLDPATRQQLDYLRVRLSPSRPDFTSLKDWGPDVYRETVGRIMSTPGSV